MNLVNTCPKNLDEVQNATKRLGCHNDQFERNQYICLPDIQKTSLVEFCYNGIMGIQEKGTCPEVNTTNGNLSTQSCTDFLTGCPEDHFWKHQLFNYTACQSINTKNQCYVSQPSCPPISSSSDSYVGISIPMIFAIIALLVFFIFIIIVLSIVLYRKGKKKDKEVHSATDEIKAKNEEKEENNHLLTANTNQKPFPTADAREDEANIMIDTPDLCQDNTNQKPFSTAGARGDETEIMIETPDLYQATKKPKIHEVKGHEFQAFVFKQPTYCSVCSKFLWGVKKQGYKCRNCNLAVHKNCHEEIEGHCNGSNNAKVMSGGIDRNYQHKFMINTYRSPTFCNHCGSLLFGVIRQGLQCQACGTNCHKKCKNFISCPCRPKK